MKPKRISSKVIYIILFSIIIIMSALAWIEYYTEKNTILNELEDIAETKIDRLSKTLVYPLWNLIHEQIDGIIEIEMDYQDVLAITLDHDRGIKGKIKINNYLETFQPEHSVLLENSLIKKSTNIKFDDSIIGTVNIYITDFYMNQHLNQLLKNKIVQTIVLSLFMTIIIFFSIRRIIISPILTLKNAISTVSKTNFEIDIKINSKDEIASLYNSFLKMTNNLKENFENLQNTKMKIIELNKNLELKVKQRTEKLENSIIEIQKTQNKLELEALEHKKTSKKLLKANQVKDAFFASMSHELRTPLNSIIGFTEQFIEGLIGDVELDDEQLETHQMILSSSKHLLGLINDILDLSKIEAGKLSLILNVFVINNIILDTLSEASSIIKHYEKEGLINIELDIPDEEFNVVCDDKRTKQIFLNILSNAIKYTNKGIVKISIKPNQNNVEISVEDSGIGIPDNMINKVFDKYIQLEDSRVKAIKSTGLGLPIAKELVQMQGGKIWLESKMNVGSKFTFTIPLCPNFLDDNEDIIKTDKKLVLCIDDNLNTLYLLNRIISSLNCLMLGALSGKTGIEKARKYKPDLITLDVLMPELNGWQVLKMMKNDTELKKIPVTIITCLDNEIKSIEFGAENFIHKPFTKDNFLNILPFDITKTTPKFRVIAIDYDIDILNNIKNLCDEEDIECLTSDNENELSELLTIYIPDLIIISDTIISKLGGVVYISRIKDEHKSLNFIIISSNDLSDYDKQKLFFSSDIIRKEDTDFKSQLKKYLKK